MLSPEIIEQCRTDIANNKLSLVIKLLLKRNLSDKSLSKQILVLSSRLRRIKERESLGTVKYEDIQIELTKIETAVLEILEYIESLHLQNQNK